MINVPQQKGF